MRRGARTPRPDLTVAPGERVLAWATDAEGRSVGATREALYVPGARIPWQLVEAADWDSDSATLRVSEVGSWGAVRPEHRLVLDAPGRLLQLIRERVTASVVLQRHVSVSGRRGLRVIARRAPSNSEDLTWLYEYDEGVDPTDPAVRLAAAQALAAARVELGEV